MSAPTTDAVMPTDSATIADAATTTMASRAPMASLLLLAALTAGVRAQGAFYPVAQVIVFGLLAAAALASVSHWGFGKLHPATWRRSHRLALALIVALAAWSTLAATSLRSAVPGAALLLALVLAFTVATRLRAYQRALVADALLVLGVLAALSGWLGVAGHIARLSHADQGLWRAATTITYANASAGFLVPLAFLGIGMAANAASRRDVVLRTLAVAVVLSGIEATLSRGGALGLAAGFVVLGLARWRGMLRGSMLRVLLPALIGSMVIFVGLVPSIPESSHAHAAIAVAALLAGLAVTAALGVAPARGRAMAAVLAMAIACVGAASVPTLRHGLSTIAQPRLTAASGERTGETHAALHAIRTHPVFGVGPGKQHLKWSVPDGFDTDHYAHDEYLQMAWKSGLPALALLLALLFVVGRQIKAGRREAAVSGMWAGSVAALAAVGVASGFDFLWHVPVIPLVSAVLAGLCSPTKKEEHA